MPGSNARRGPRRRKVERVDNAAEKAITALRRELAAVDDKAIASTEGEHQRLMVIAALWSVRTFLEGLQPALVSKVLWRHMELLSDLYFHRKDSSLESSVAYGRLPTIELQVRDGLIAAAVKLLSIGGERGGNYSRDKACLIVAELLNRAGVIDRNKAFSQRRVLNIFIDVMKLNAKRQRAKRNRRTGSDFADVVAVLKDRNRQLTYYTYESGLAGFTKIEEMMPDAFRTKEKRKKGAAYLIRSISRKTSESHHFTHPKIEVR